MAVGGVGWDPAKKRPKTLCVTNGTLSRVAADFQAMIGLVGYFGRQHQ
jgi:hypothetical protein